MPGCLTVSQECVQFEPDPRFGLVQSMGIGCFQAYVDVHDVVECGSISMPKSDN